MTFQLLPTASPKVGFESPDPGVTAGSHDCPAWVVIPAIFHMASLQGWSLKFIHSSVLGIGLKPYS